MLGHFEAFEASWGGSKEHILPPTSNKNRGLGIFMFCPIDPLENIKYMNIISSQSLKLNCETQPPASIGWVALSSVVRRRRASVTSPLISTIWGFRASKPYIFCEDMILASCQCQHIFCCWVEPSLLLSSSSLESIAPYNLTNHATLPQKSRDPNKWTSRI